MVMPRAFSSGAASISSYFLASPPNLADSTVAIAAVRVVLPWSTWPIVPTLTCGLVRSNLPFAILLILQKNDVCLLSLLVAGPARCTGPVPAFLLAYLDLLGLRADDRFGHILRRFSVVLEFHGVSRTTLGGRTQRGRVAEHLGQRNLFFFNDTAAT